MKVQYLFRFSDKYYQENKKDFNKNKAVNISSIKTNVFDDSYVFLVIFCLDKKLLGLLKFFYAKSNKIKT